MVRDVILMKRRLSLFLSIIIICTVALIARLSYVQFVVGNEITDKAFDLWARNIPVEGQRGIIYDRNGNIIVGNQFAPSVALIPKQIHNQEETARFLARVLDIEYEDALEHVNKQVSIELIKPEGRKLSHDQAVEIIDANLRGVYLVGDTKRYYPYGDYLAHVVGFTGIDNQGITGIEYIYDDILMGENGASKYYTDAKGNEMTNLFGDYVAPTQGMDIYLTIDIEVQMLLERVLDNAMARYEPDQILGLAMNPQTGEIYAMSSRPTYNPATYQDYDQEIYNRNLPIWMSYEPGSTFKIITYSAALEEGVFELDEHFYDPGYAIVDGARIKDWKAGGHGDQTFLEVIQNSCNPGFIELGMRLGTDKLFDYIYAYGFGEKTGVDLLGESSGIVFDKEDVGPVELATSAFGQGNSVTPIQLVSAASAAVNGGILYQPYVLKSVSMPYTGVDVYEAQPKEVRRVISEETSKTMQFALESVVAKGTGRNAYIDGYRVGGKTGTAQKPVDGVYVEGEYILSFIGIAPMNDPQLAVYIAIDNPKNTIQYGGVVAAPLVKEVMQEALPILGVERQEDQIEKEYRWNDLKYHTVPNFIGLSQDELPDSIYYDYQFYGSGTTVSLQSPAPGERVQEGGTVLIFLR